MTCHVIFFTGGKSTTHVYSDIDNPCSISLKKPVHKRGGGTATPFENQQDEKDCEQNSQRITLPKLTMYNPFLIIISLQNKAG